MAASVEQVPLRANIPIRELLSIGVLAVVMRLLLFAALVVILRFPAGSIASMRDGHGYLAYAAAMLRGGSGFAALDPFDARLFPGYPALIALVGTTGAPLSAIALASNWVSTALAAPLAALLFRDVRIGWAMAVLTPSYVMYSTLAMSEASLLLVITLGLLLAVRGRPSMGGALNGLAILIRPFGFAASVGFALFELRRPRRLGAFVISAIAVVAAGLLAMRFWSGAFVPGWRVYHGPRAFHGDVFTWPFHSLFATWAPPWKAAYIWTHVMIVLIGCALLVRDSLRRDVDPLVTLAMPWLIINTLIVLCIGGAGGFHEFHRYILVALPPLFFAYRAVLPRRAVCWLPIAVVSLALAFVGASSGG